MDEIFDPFEDLGGDQVDETAQVVAGGTSAVVFVVDVRESMFSVTNEMQEPAITLSFQCIRQWIRNFIFASDKLLCSIILVGSGKSKNPVDSKNIYVVLDLKEVGADTVKEIDRLLSLVNENAFSDEYGSGAFSLADALWVSSNMFTELKRKLRKRVILFTSDGCPFPKSQDRVRVYSKIADMKNSEIAFQLVPFGVSFESKFYKELLDEMGDGYDAEKCGIVLKFDDAINRGPEPKKRHVSLANVPFVISKDYSLIVQIHPLVVKARLPYATKLSKETNLPVTSKTTFVRVDGNATEESSQRSVSNSDQPTVGMSENVLFYEQAGTEWVSFTTSEMDEINAIGVRQLKLLGFKPRSTLTLEHHVKPCAFVYPDEKRAKGAVTFFHALMEVCRKKDVVAVCSFCPRPTSTVQYVALEVNSSPPGFLMITLPFGGEVRDTEEESLRNPDDCATAEQVEITDSIVKKLRREFNPDDFPQPELAAYWAGVEALALDLPQPENVPDSSEPDIEAMSDRLGNLTTDFNSCFFPDGCGSHRGKKSTAGKVSDPIADIAEVEDCYQNNTLHTLTLDTLKSYLKSVGLGLGLSKKKKADLINLIKKFLDKSSGK